MLSVCTSDTHSFVAVSFMIVSTTYFGCQVSENAIIEECFLLKIVQRRTLFKIRDATNTYTILFLLELPTVVYAWIHERSISAKMYLQNKPYCLIDRWKKLRNAFYRSRIMIFIATLPIFSVQSYHFTATGKSFGTGPDKWTLFRSLGSIQINLNRWKQKWTHLDAYFDDYSLT